MSWPRTRAIHSVARAGYLGAAPTQQRRPDPLHTRVRAHLSVGQPSVEATPTGQDMPFGPMATLCALFDRTGRDHGKAWSWCGAEGRRFVV